jgi:hypothetical protein
MIVCAWGPPPYRGNHEICVDQKSRSGLIGYRSLLQAVSKQGSDRLRPCLQRSAFYLPIESCVPIFGFEEKVRTPMCECGTERNGTGWETDETDPSV